MISNLAVVLFHAPAVYVSSVRSFARDGGDNHGGDGNDWGKRAESSPPCPSGCVHETVDRKKQEEAGLGGLKHFALKALSKKAVIERGQLAHVRDEKLLLQNMNHPLILELFSTFQVGIDPQLPSSAREPVPLVTWSLASFYPL